MIKKHRLFIFMLPVAGFGSINSFDEITFGRERSQRPQAREAGELGSDTQSVGACSSDDWSCPRSVGYLEEALKEFDVEHQFLQEEPKSKRPRGAHSSVTEIAPHDLHLLSMPESLGEHALIQLVAQHRPEQSDPDVLFILQKLELIETRLAQVERSFAFIDYRLSAMTPSTRPEASSLRPESATPSAPTLGLRAIQTEKSLPVSTLPAQQAQIDPHCRLNTFEKITNAWRFVSRRVFNRGLQTAISMLNEFASRLPDEVRDKNGVLMQRILIAKSKRYHQEFVERKGDVHMTEEAKLAMLQEALNLFDLILQDRLDQEMYEGKALRSARVSYNTLKKELQGSLPWG